MSKFKVGDVCVVLYSYKFPYLKGSEVTILSPPEEFFDVFTGQNKTGYLTDLVIDGIEIAFKEECLRLKKFPGEEQVMKLFTEVTKRDVVPA